MKSESRKPLIIDRNGSVKKTDVHDTRLFFGFFRIIFLLNWNTRPNRRSLRFPELLAVLPVGHRKISVEGDLDASTGGPDNFVAVVYFG
jgi:hypothetical protein